MFSIELGQMNLVIHQQYAEIRF